MIFFKRSNSFNISSLSDERPAPPPPPAATDAAGADLDAIGADGGLDGGGLILGGPFIKDGDPFTPGEPAPGDFGGNFGGGGNPEGDFAGGALGGVPGVPDLRGGALGGPDGGALPEGGPDGAPAVAGADPPGPPDNMLNNRFAAFSRAF